MQEKIAACDCGDRSGNSSAGRRGAYREGFLCTPWRRNWAPAVYVAQALYCKISFLHRRIRSAHSGRHIAVLIIIAVAASAVPARNAMRIDPALALKTE